MNIFHNSPTIKKSDYVYQELIKKILSGEWGLGKEIVVNELIDSLNVSRRPIMDALKILEGEGFLEIVPQSGCHLVNPSKKDVIDQLLLSHSLEALCTELAAKNSEPSQIEKLITFNEKYIENPAIISNNPEYFTYNREIHNGITEMANSKRISSVSRLMWNLNDFFLMNLLPYNVNRIEKSINEHHQILLAIKDKDIDGAKKFMKEHLLSYVEEIENLNM